jgi:hypothetical protein
MPGLETREATCAGFPRRWLMVALMFWMANSCWQGHAQFGTTNGNIVKPSPLKAPKPEIPPTFWEQHSTAIVGGGFGAAVVLSALAYLAFRPRAHILPPPAVVARQRLTELKTAPADGLLLTRISSAVRQFFLATARLPVEELTTAEFISVLEDRVEVPPPLKARVSVFLRALDLQKFSPSGSPAEAQGIITQALEFVNEAEALTSRPPAK